MADPAEMEFSDVIWQNPAGLRAESLSALSKEEYLEQTSDDPEDWAFMETEKLARLLAERGDEEAFAELRARADAGDPASAAKWLDEPPTG